VCGGRDYLSVPLLLPFIPLLVRELCLRQGKPISLGSCGADQRQSRQARGPSSPPNLGRCAAEACYDWQIALWRTRWMEIYDTSTVAEWG
jgi:hypothetical protein